MHQKPNPAHNDACPQGAGWELARAEVSTWLFHSAVGIRSKDRGLCGGRRQTLEVCALHLLWYLTEGQSLTLCKPGGQSCSAGFTDFQDQSQEGPPSLGPQRGEGLPLFPLGHGPNSDRDPLPWLFLPRGKSPPAHRQTATQGPLTAFPTVPANSHWPGCARNGCQGDDATRTHNPPTGLHPEAPCDSSASRVPT